ncbi:hypothetical protein CEXT_627361 [Caerostris extrusa]|uniref:Uncharacterized protein n=1 Tax=Caerostris extrusa TaxID=172846 RepID=A0AAV4PW82_CAEEX|nr:hypothetical protein CEXT_627361 [Caerostris extrusa]
MPCLKQKLACFFDSQSAVYGLGRFSKSHCYIIEHAFYFMPCLKQKLAWILICFGLGRFQNPIYIIEYAFYFMPCLKQKLACFFDSHRLFMVWVDFQNPIATS